MNWETPFNHLSFENDPKEIKKLKEVLGQR
jgi:hypothetical protein